MTREDLEKRKIALLAYIHDAFKGVTREGGVSWSESYAIDNYESLDEQLRMRALDTESSWESLVEDPRWIVHLGAGGFHFLDAIGCRYYLPAVMVRVVRFDEIQALSAFAHHENFGDVYDLSCLLLTVSKGVDEEPEPTMWSLLNRRQQLCVAQFLKYMIDFESIGQEPWFHEWFTDAYNSYWKGL